MDLPLATLVDLIRIPAAAEIKREREAVLRAREAAFRVRSASQVKQILLVMKRFAADNDGALPANLDELEPFFAGGKKGLICPLSGEPYVYRGTVAGKLLKDFRNQDDIVVIHSPVGPKGGAVGFLDGHVQSYPGFRFGRMLEQALIEEAEMQRHRQKKAERRKQRALEAEREQQEPKQKKPKQKEPEQKEQEIEVDEEVF